MRVCIALAVLGAFCFGVFATNAVAQSCPGNYAFGGGEGGAPPCLQPIRPVLNCVQPNTDGTFTAQWGYESDNATCCPDYEIPIRTEGVIDPFSGDFDPRANFFTPAPIDRGQPSFFTPGVQTQFFSTTWDGSPLSWTLRYFTLTPPLFFEEVTATANTSAITQYCSTDCLGVPNGSAVIDRCGVCAGNGTTCLGCESTNIASLQLALDGGAQDQAALIINALYRYRRVVGNSTSARRYERKTREQARALANQNWVATWSFSSVVTTCTNTEFCVTVSTSPFTSSYRAVSEQLLNLALDVTARIEKRAKRRAQKVAARLIRRTAQTMHETNVVNAGLVPANQSTCS